MTDRVNMLHVVLERDTRIDDCEPLIAAIMQLRGVLSVTARVAKPEDHLAQTRAKRLLADTLWNALESAFSGTAKQ